MSSSSDEAEFDDDSSDDMPLSGLKNKTKQNGALNDDESPRRKRTARGKPVSYAEDDDDEGSEDDIPLVMLKDSPKKKTSNGTKKAAPPAKKKAKATPKSKSKTSSASTVSKSTGSSADNYQSASAALYGSGCKKGLLIQRLLCRWWYAITWPDPAALPKEPPKHYDALDGFPGVYICTEGDAVGAIQDIRDKEKCPNFNNFAKKSSEELQQLLIKACQEQLRQLIEAEGNGTATEKELKDIIKWATKIKPPTADKEAAKVLKAAKLTLP